MINRPLTWVLGLGLGLTVLVTIGGDNAGAQARGDNPPPPSSIAQRKAQMSGTAQADAVLRYGPHERQNVRLYAPPPGTPERGPLVLFVHGGGWSFGRNIIVNAKPAWAGRMGLWFGSVGYRVLPDAPVEDQARDVGAAIRKARAEAARHGYDPDRIILMGHSAGAHLAALVATDARYAGDGFAAIRAVIPIDGAAYDVARQMQTAPPFALRQIYDRAFGTDPARQAALSPVTYAPRRAAPRWLVIHVANRAASRGQAGLLVDAVRKGGGTARAVAISGTHMTANRDFGTSDYPAQADVDALVRAIIAEK